MAKEKRIFDSRAGRKIRVIYKNRAVCKSAQNSLFLTDFYGAVCTLSPPEIPGPAY